MTTRDRILNEALTLFAENGYDGTSVEEIAEKVGIKAPSLYNHFKGKEDILNALIDMAEARYEEFFGSDKHFGNVTYEKKEAMTFIGYHTEIRPDEGYLIHAGRTDR